MTYTEFCQSRDAINRQLAGIERKIDRIKQVPGANYNYTQLSPNGMQLLEAERGRLTAKPRRIKEEYEAVNIPQNTVTVQPRGKQ